MTDLPPRGATPDDIEAALQHVRAGLDATPKPEPPERTGRGGSLGFIALLAAAALLGGAATLLLPRLLGVHGATDDQRIVALEQRIGQLGGASGSLDSRAITALQSRLAALETRVGTLESAPAASPELQQRLDVLEKGFIDLEDRLAALGDRVAEPGAVPPVTGAPPPPPDNSAVVALAAQLQALTAQLAELESRLASVEAAAPNQALVAALDRRLSELENADPGAAARNAALALAISRLSAAADSGRGFRVELEALKLVAPPTLDTAPFEPYAANGLTTVRGLAEWLNGIDGAIRDGADADRGGDWFERFWRGLGRLVTVKPAGEPQGSEPEDRLLRAQRRLERNDLAGAVREIDLLQGAARAPAEAWLIDAHARLALDAALASLTARILADLSRQAP